MRNRLTGPEAVNEVARVRGHLAEQSSVAWQACESAAPVTNVTCVTRSSVVEGDLGGLADAFGRVRLAVASANGSILIGARFGDGLASAEPVREPALTRGHVAKEPRGATKARDPTAPIPDLAIAHAAGAFMVEADLCGTSSAIASVGLAVASADGRVDSRACQWDGLAGASDVVDAAGSTRLHAKQPRFAEVGIRCESAAAFPFSQSPCVAADTAAAGAAITARAGAAKITAVIDVVQDIL
ncbi:MAG: hypothetical protein ABJA82_02045 [Myxococcales bacterium]